MDKKFLKLNRNLDGDDLDDLMEDDDIEAIRQEGDGEDEIEDFLTQEYIDTRNHLKYNKIENEIIRKFNMHKQLQSLISSDLK